MLLKILYGQLNLFVFSIQFYFIAYTCRVFRKNVLKSARDTVAEEPRKMLSTFCQQSSAVLTIVGPCLEKFVGPTHIIKMKG